MAAGGTAGTVQLCQTPTGNAALENKQRTGKLLTGKLHTNTELYSSSPPALPPPQPSPRRTFPILSRGFIPVLNPRDLSQNTLGTRGTDPRVPCQEPLPTP